MATKTKTAPKWEIKDRSYYLINGKSPLTYTIKGKNIFWFDKEKGFERELKYTLNQKTCFVDEFKGDARLGHIVFEDGVLIVPKEKQTLQKLMSLYHPDNGRVFAEFDAEQEAEDELDIIELEIDALNAAKSMDIDQAEAIVRSNIGSEVSKMTSKEIKRDLLLFAKNDPVLFLELANDDDINIRNMAIKAAEMGILVLSDDQRTFKWASTNKKIMTVPFDEHPYSAFTAFLKTDEGLEIYKSIEKRLK